MSDVPLITVYTPAYNVARYIRDAVRSVQAQTYTSFEYLIVDDGSTDSTVSIVRELATTDPRIRLFERPHRGVSATANDAIEFAQGQFLARMDADDIAAPTRLERQSRYLIDHPDCVVVGSRAMQIDETGLPLFEQYQISTSPELIEKSLLNGGWSLAQATCMFRRSALIEAGCYRSDLPLHEDLDLFLRLAELGTLANLPEVLQFYRQRFDSLTYAGQAKSERILNEILGEARRRRGLPPAESAAPHAKPAVSVETIDRFRDWAWKSLKAKNVITARKYARLALRRAPLSRENWKLMYCTLRGH